MTQPAAGPTPTNPFNSDPAGAFFVGRHQELQTFHQWLAGINDYPQHACVIGRAASGKTSFLLKAASEAESLGIIACRPRLNAHRSAEENLNVIIESLLEAIDKAARLGLRRDWESGPASTFRVPKKSSVRSDDLVSDLRAFSEQLAGPGNRQRVV
jgi:hypothetical protein